VTISKTDPPETLQLEEIVLKELYTQTPDLSSISLQIGVNGKLLIRQKHGYAIFDKTEGVIVEKTNYNIAYGDTSPASFPL